MTRALVLATTLTAAASAHAAVKVADDDRNGEGLFSRLDYGVSERLDRAWLVLHFTHRAPCRDVDGECEFDDPLPVHVPGLTYEPSRKQIVYREGSGAPLVCAQVVHHSFIWSWETVDPTGSCGYRIADVDRFVDDGYAGRQDRRKEILFGPSAAARR
jgi:hypothetical protein